MKSSASEPGLKVLEKISSLYVSISKPSHPNPPTTPFWETTDVAYEIFNVL